jgi:hypothetical protein
VFLVRVAAVAVAVFGMLQMPQRAAKLFDFVLVGIFLALGELEGFENFVHIIQSFAQCLNYAIHVFDSSLNRSGRGGMSWSRSGWLRGWRRFGLRFRLNIRNIRSVLLLLRRDLLRSFL